MTKHAQPTLDFWNWRYSLTSVNPPKEDTRVNFDPTGPHR